MFTDEKYMQQMRDSCILIEQSVIFLYNARPEVLVQGIVYF